MRALFDFDGSFEAGCISIKKGELIELLLGPAGELWWQGKNSLGQVGSFPAAYVEEVSAAAAIPYVPSVYFRVHFNVSRSALRSHASDVSVTSNSYKVCRHFYHAIGLLLQPPMRTLDLHIDSNESSSDPVPEDQNRADDSVVNKVVFGANRSSNKGEQFVALRNVTVCLCYTVYASHTLQSANDEDLSFRAGEAITLLTTRTGKVGWWRGSHPDGSVGLFRERSVRFPTRTVFLTAFQ